MSLNAAHQNLLQIFLNQGVLDHQKFHDIFRALLIKYNLLDPHQIGRDLKEHYVPFLKKINEAICDFYMEIRSGTSQISGCPFFCLVKQCDTASIGKLSQLYSALELKVFRNILTMIVETDEGCVDYNAIVSNLHDYFNDVANNLASQSQSTKVPTNKELRAIVQKFMHDYWLVEVYNKPNMIALHGRTLIELSHYLMEVFGDQQLNRCFWCKNLLMIGIGCDKCDMKLHKHCAKALLAKTNNKCPSCKETFSVENVKAHLDDIESARRDYLDLRKS